MLAGHLPRRPMKYASLTDFGEAVRSSPVECRGARLQTREHESSSVFDMPGLGLTSPVDQLTNQMCRWNPETGGGSLFWFATTVPSAQSL